MPPRRSNFRPISKDGRLYALICSQPQVDGLQFFTPAECEMQVGVMSRPAGYTVPAHQHACRAKIITGVSEFLYLESGRAEYTVFDETWGELARATIMPGDFVLSLHGGHELKMLADTRIIEIKQGPAFAENLVKIFPAPA
jgi:oxalate decarboxylase/phosphoglucose isomerase-like protein (cupin superfamily)